MGRDVSWELKGQELVVKEKRTYDKLIVAVKGINGNPMSMKLVNHYYDIRKYINILTNEKQQNDEKMMKMKIFLDEMNRQTEV